MFSVRRLTGGRRDDEGDLGFLGRDVGWHADPEVVAMVAFGGGVDDGLAINVGGDDGAGHFGVETVLIDDGAIENPGVEIGRGLAGFDVLDEIGKRDAPGFVAVLPFDMDGEAVGTGDGGNGLRVFVRALVLGVELVEQALGGGLIAGQQQGELELDGPHLGFEDGFVDFFPGFVNEGVFDGQLLMKDAARNAQFACGGIDLDAVEVVNAGRDLLEKLPGFFQLGLGVRFGRRGLLGRQ